MSVSIPSILLVFTTFARSIPNSPIIPFTETWSALTLSVWTRMRPSGVALRVPAVSNGMPLLASFPLMSSWSLSIETDSSFSGESFFPNT